MFASIKVGREYVCGVVVELAIEDALDHPEHVGRGEDDAGGGEDGPAGVMRDTRLHATGEDEELADEAVEHGQADDRECGDDEHGHHPRKFCGEAAVIAHVVGAIALVEDAEEHEERAAADAFVESGVDAAVDACDGEGEDAEDDDADVAKRSVGGELLEILLDESDECTVDDADRAESDHQRGDAARLVWEDAEGEAQDGVEAEFSRKDHDCGGRGFGDSVGEPAVKREDRDLDGEGDEEGERGQPESGGVVGDSMSAGDVGELRKLEGAGACVEPEHADEKDRRGDEGVEEVFDGCAAAVDGAAEGGDQQHHRDEGELPEGVVEEEVERDEDAEHRNLLEQEEDVEELLALRDGVPGDEYAERSEEASEYHEPHGKAIDAEVVADGRGVDPREIVFELESARRGGVVVADREVEGEDEGDEGDGERSPLHQLASVGHQREQNRSRERGEGDEGQDDVIDIYRGVHRFLWVLRLRVNLKATTEADPYGMTNKKTNDGKTKALMRPNSPSEDHDE